ncbi:MAG TPA: hypothetical protein VL334_12655 [Anaerolineae bacterium]|nr:hypothetical protein [Anaerolineae bacterium]
MNSTSFDRTAGLAAILAALVGLLYAVSFVVLQNALLYSLCLMLGGLLSLVALVALFERLGEVDAQVAMLGLMMGAVAALGATIHGGYDLANVLNPPAALPEGVAALPSQIDPRGLLTFGITGLAVLVAGLLMRRHPGFSPGFTALTFTLGVLLIIVYLGRLIVLSPTSPLVLTPAALTGFVVNPLWYVLLGLNLRRVAVPADAPALTMA